jgi:signal transduction histidine kinase
MNFRISLWSALALIILWIKPVALSAQPVVRQKTDIAIQQLAGTRDTVRVDLLLLISEELRKSQPNEAFGYAREALMMAQELRDTYRTGLAYRAIAGVYIATAVYDKALEYLLMALGQFERLGDTLEIAICYDELGVVHMSSGDFTNAQINLHRALNLNKKIGNPAQIARNYMNMGSNYLKADSVDKGLSYFMVSLMIADSLNMEQDKVTLLNNIGYGYARLGRHEDALRNFYKVLELLGKQPDDLSRSDALVNIAMGYYRMNNFTAALKYAREGYILAKSRRFDHVYRNASKVLSDIYAAQGNFQKAYKYIKEYRDISDTVMNAEKAEQLTSIQTLYDLNLKEEENISLRQENFKNQKRMQTRTLVIIIITMLVVVLAVLLYMLNRMNNRQLALNKKLAVQSGELEALNDLKDKFFSFVAHNLKNPFNTIMGFSELIQRATESRDMKKTRQYSGLIYDLSSQVQKVLSNLLDWSRLQRRSFEVKPETVELTSLIKDVVEMNNKEAARKDIGLNITNEGNVFVVADRSMITTVLQNLVTNAVNFTPPAGQISIDCRVKDQYTEVTITDNGIGISEENLARLFDFDFSQAKVGSSDHGGAGLGLVICHEMLMKNGGTIHAESNPGKGSSFTFTLPVAIRHDTGIETEEQHAENTPADVTDDLLASETVVSGAILADFRLYIVPHFEEVSRVLSIENLEHFAKSVMVTGEKFNLVSLANFGKSLNSLTLGHQIDQIIRMLPRFREYLDKIMKQQ